MLLGILVDVSRYIIRRAKVTTRVICIQNIFPRLYMSEHTKHNIPRKSSFNNFFIDIRRQLRVDEKYYKSENIKTPKQIHVDEMFNARLVRMLQKKKPST